LAEPQSEKFLKKLIGRNDIKAALSKLDKLTQEEARMATTQVLKVTSSVDEKVVSVNERVKVIDDRIAEIIDGSQTLAHIVDQAKRSSSHNLIRPSLDGGDSSIIAGNQLHENLRKWLSPPDPSTNHNTACGAHLKGTATWFFQESIFQRWKSTNSLLWIHGKRTFLIRCPVDTFRRSSIFQQALGRVYSGSSDLTYLICPRLLMPFVSSTIIQAIKAMCKAGEASMGYFDFDFRDTSKQHGRDLVTSLLFQLSALSDPHCEILSHLYAAHDCGATQPSDQDLKTCLKEMLTVSDHCPSYIIIYALDESPDTFGIPCPRDQVLQLVKELVELRLPELHICVTSRPKPDIRGVLGPLNPLRISLHHQSGQHKDIMDYVRSVVYSNSEQIIKRWRKEEKDLVIETLSKRAEGM